MSLCAEPHTCCSYVESLASAISGFGVKSVHKHAQNSKHSRSQMKHARAHRNCLSHAQMIHFIHPGAFRERFNGHDCVYAHKRRLSFRKYPLNGAVALAPINVSESFAEKSKASSIRIQSTTSQSQREISSDSESNSDPENS